MRYQNTVTTQLLSYDELRAQYPSVSMPADGANPIVIITDQGPPVVEDEWQMIVSTPKPAYIDQTEGCIEIPPVAYSQTWSIIPLDQQTIDNNIQAAKDVKYDQSELYAEQLVNEANATPYVGKTTSAIKNKRKVNARMNRATNGKPKVDQDKDRDDALADHTDDIADAQDIADDVIEASNDARAIYAMDVTSIVTWPTWTPPA